MAYSTVTYTASSSKAFSIAFTDESGHADTGSKPFLSESHIKAKVKGVANSDFTISGTTLTFGGSTTIVAGDLVEIYRETPRTIAGRTVDFADASLLSASDLDKASIHEQFIIQEILDRAGPAKKWSAPSTYSFDAAGKKITDLGTPTAATDAATKDYVDTHVVFQGGAASAQCWEFTGDGSKDTFQLQAPIASNDVNELFIVEVQGVMQAPSANSGSPARDFKVYKDTNGDYQLEFESGAFGTGVSAPPNTHKIVVQNMGISKSALSGALIFESDDAGNIPLTIKGASGQTAALLSLTDSSAAVKFKVENDGDIVGGNTALTSNDASESGLTITGASGQSANLLEVANGGVNHVVIDANGKTTLAKDALVADSGSTADAATITKTGSTTGHILVIKEGSNTFQITDNDGRAFIDSIHVGGHTTLDNPSGSGSDARPAIAVRAYTNQPHAQKTLEVADDAGSANFWVTKAGNGYCRTYLAETSTTAASTVSGVPLGGGLVGAAVVTIGNGTSSGVGRSVNAGGLNISSATKDSATATKVWFAAAMPDTKYIVMVTPRIANDTSATENACVVTYKSEGHFKIAHPNESIGASTTYELNIMVYLFAS